MKKILVLSVVILILNVANAQWQHLNLHCSAGVSAITGNTGQIFAGTMGDGAYLSTNNGLNWAPINSGLNSTDIVTYFINGINIYVGTSNGVFLSTNNGSSWTAISNGLPTAAVVSAFAIKDTIIFAGTNRGVYKSINNGANWTSANNGLPVLVDPPVIFSLVVKGSNLYAGTGTYGIYLSTDNGANWTAINNGASLQTSRVNSIIVIGSNLFIATNNGIYLSTNNGTNWVAKNNGLTNLYISSLVANGTNIFAASYNGKGVYLSTNNGTSWGDVSTGISNMYIYSLALIGSNLYVGDVDTTGIWKRPITEMTNIIENKLNISFSISPNPTSTNLTIETNSNSKQSIEIINLIGQSIYTSLIDNKATIDVSALTKGIYILKLTTDKGTIVKKFVKE